MTRVLVIAALCAIFCSLALGQAANVYVTPSGYIGGTCNGCSTLATWQSASGYEAHAIANETAAENVFFKLNSACVNGSVAANCAPQTSSPLIGAGKNLYSFFNCSSPVIPGLGDGCTDITGTARPSTGAWTIGPYQAAATPSGGIFTFGIAWF
jgi:hypothetical protein